MGVIPETFASRLLRDLEHRIMARWAAVRLAALIPRISPAGRAQLVEHARVLRVLEDAYYRMGGPNPEYWPAVYRPC